MSNKKNAKEVGDSMAFPVNTAGSPISVRDWFAAQALQGILAAKSGAPRGPSDVDDAYQLADSMLNKKLEYEQNNEE